MPRLTRCSNEKYHHCSGVQLEGENESNRLTLKKYYFHTTVGKNVKHKSLHL